MDEKEFRELLTELDELSGNELEDKLKEVEGEPELASLLTGEEYDAIGLGKKSVKNVAQDVIDFEDTEGSLTQSLREHEDGDGPDGHSIASLYLDLDMLDRKSGNDQKEFLKEMFEDYAYPSVVSYAVLNDWSLGFTSNSIARALDLKESLPFYDSVVGAMRADEPLTQPEVGKSFSPMLAKSESSLPDDLSDWWAQPKLDGYRLLLHVADTEDGQNATAFTRRMNDVTESLPELEEIDWPQGEYIFDAEVIASDGTYNSTSERVGRSAENVEREQEMHFGLFDVLVANGDHIHDEPYGERHQILKSGVFDDDRVFVLEAKDATRQEAQEMGRDYEGVIWKDPDAPYEFDKRSSNWVKEKNEAEEIDVVVSDFHEGEGRLNDSLGKLSVESADGTPLGAVGTGFTDAQRQEIWENRDEWEGKTIELTAEAFQDGLRFPRFERDRSDDGEPDDIDRIEEVLPEP